MENNQLTLNDFKEGVRNYIFYILIFLVSITVTIFLPMIGTQSDQPFMMPKDIANWIFYIGTKILIALFNVLLFDLFVRQGKWNVRNNDKHILARSKLNKLKNKNDIPTSPGKHMGTIYGTKGVTVLLMSSITAFILPACVIAWDWMLFLSCVITVVFGVIMGVITMKNEEYWWTEEYLKYAIYKEEQITKESELNDNSQRQDLSQPTGTSS